jgi:hypothetical protein
VEFLFGSAVDSQVDQTVGVSPFVIVPRDDLVEVVVKENASTSINGGGMLVVDQVARHKLFLRVSKDTVHGSVGSFLESGKDFFTTCSLFRTEGQIHDGNICSRDLWIEKGRRSIYQRAIQKSSSHMHNKNLHE